MDSGTLRSLWRPSGLYYLYLFFCCTACLNLECLCLVLVFRVSSTSVEQARERGYHRALLLSDHRKDTGQTRTHFILNFFVN